MDKKKPAKRATSLTELREITKPLFSAVGYEKGLALKLRPTDVVITPFQQERHDLDSTDSPYASHPWRYGFRRYLASYTVDRDQLLSRPRPGRRTASEPPEHLKVI